MENSCKICGGNHLTGACQEFNKSREEATQDAKSRVKKENKERGRSLLGGLFNKERKPLNEMDILQMDAEKEQLDKIGKKFDEERMAEKERRKTMYVAGPIETKEDEQEQSNQEFVAARRPWLVAKTDQTGKDVGDLLKKLGFKVKVATTTPYFYEVNEPQGWTKMTNNYWTEIKDESGNVVLNQFYKGAYHNERAHVQLPSGETTSQEVKKVEEAKNTGRFTN